MSEFEAVVSIVAVAIAGASIILIVDWWDSRHE